MINLSLPKLLNGTWMIVEELQKNLIVANINIGTFKNEIVMIPRCIPNLSEGEDVTL